MLTEPNAILFQERHSYLDPNIRITRKEGTVSIIRNSVNWFFRDTSILIEGIGKDGRPFHKLFTFCGDLDFDNLSAFRFRYRSQQVTAFSLWKVTQADMMKLLLNLGSEKGKRTKNRLISILSELEKVGIKASKISWFSLFLGGFAIKNCKISQHYRGKKCLHSAK